MIDGVPFKKQASLIMNKDFINIYPKSGYRLMIEDSSQYNVFFNHNVLDKELGRQLREAIGLSRFVHPVNDKEVDSYLYNPERYKEWIDLRIQKFGYQTKNKLFKPMLSCHVVSDNGFIRLEPSNQRALESWDRTGLTEADNVTIPETCTDEELGAAARLALSRCTSKFIDQDD